VQGTIQAIRGAVQVDTDEPELIIAGTQELLQAVMTRNARQLALASCICTSCMLAWASSMDPLSSCSCSAAWAASSV
jgi:chorismate mutase